MDSKTEEKPAEIKMHPLGECTPFKLTPVGMGEPIKQIDSNGKVKLIWKVQKNGGESIVTRYE